MIRNEQNKTKDVIQHLQSFILTTKKGDADLISFATGMVPL